MQTMNDIPPRPEEDKRKFAKICVLSKCTLVGAGPCFRPVGKHKIVKRTTCTREGGGYRGELAPRHTISLLHSNEKTRHKGNLYAILSWDNSSTRRLDLAYQSDIAFHVNVEVKRVTREREGTR